MELTTRQIQLLLASLNGSMKRMEADCPMRDEVDEIYTTLSVEILSRLR